MMKSLENTIVLVIDEQEDFTRGTLGSPAAIKTIPVIKDMLEKMLENGLPKNHIIFTRDTHQSNYLNTFEGEHLPVEHCIHGTAGWNIVSELLPLANSGCLIIDKPTFGSFAIQQVIKPNTEKIIITGLCTDICVISNALILRAAFPEIEIEIIANACAGVTEESHKAALTIAKSCQIDVTTFKR